MFYAYAILMMVSGIAMIVIAAAVSTQGAGSRVFCGLFGAGYLGYGVYLLAFQRNGGYFVFFYALILPVLLIIRAVRAAAARSAERRILAATPKPIPFPYAYPPQYLPTDRMATVMRFPAPQFQSAAPGEPRFDDAPQFPATRQSYRPSQVIPFPGTHLRQSDTQRNSGRSDLN
jgi:hypothetical protein